MRGELFGHLLAAMIFGASQQACKSAVQLALDISPYRGTPTAAARKEAALKEVEAAARKLLKLYPEGPPPEPEVCTRPLRYCTVFGVFVGPKVVYHVRGLRRPHGTVPCTGSPKLHTVLVNARTCGTGECYAVPHARTVSSCTVWCAWSLGTGDCYAVPFAGLTSSHTVCNLLGIEGSD